MQRVDKSTKDELKAEFGSPPLRDEPLDVDRYNYVMFSAVGGPIYSINRGRVFDIVDSIEEARENHGGVSGHDGAIAENHDFDGRYVNVRTGPATFEYSWVPIEAVLQIVAPGCEWVGGDGYQPLDYRKGPFGDDMDAK